MSVRATNWAWEHGKAGVVGRGELLVLLRIADHADHDGVCFPGQKHIGEYVGMTPRSVGDNIARLEEKGLLRQRRRVRGEGRGRAFNVIELVLEEAQEQPEETSARSEATNRKLDVDQPEAGRAPYIEEPSGTVCSSGEEDKSSSPSHVGEENRQPTATQLLQRTRRTEVHDVFLAWVEGADKRHGDTLLTPERARIIRKALAAYPLDDVLDAVVGWKHSRFHRGENTEGTVHNELTLLLRNGGQIESFRDLHRAHGAKPPAGEAFLRDAA